MPRRPTPEPSRKPARKPAASSQPDRAAKRAQRRERRAQLRTAFATTRRSDPRLLPYVAAAGVLPIIVLVTVGILVGHVASLSIIGVLAGATAGVVIFGRRAQKAAYAQVQGQLGAGAAVLQAMRGNWRVTPAVSFNREQDLVHRVLGRPGVVLVGEGAAHRVRQLMTNEKRRLSRGLVGPETPIYEVLVGDGSGQVPLRGLERHLVKLPRNLKPKDVNALEVKLKAASGPALPLPKGPLPQGGRVPRRPGRR